MRPLTSSTKNKNNQKCRKLGAWVFAAAFFAVVLSQYLLVSLEEYPSHNRPSKDIVVSGGGSEWKIAQNDIGSLSRDTTTNSTATATDTTNLSIPEWMQDYIRWHTLARRTLLTPEIWQQQPEKRPKLLILQCLPSNVKCGGLADRLKPLPLLILGAHQTKRLLLIRWRERPCRLEEFLVPPVADRDNGLPLSLDWRVPDWLDDELGLDYEGFSRRHIINVKPFIKAIHQSSDKQIVTVTMQWWDGGEQAYKDALGLGKKDDEFQRIYHDLFRILFEPTKPIQQRLNGIYMTTALGSARGTPVDYTVAHYRALWWEDQSPPTWQQQVETAQNAVNCAGRLASKRTSANNSPPIFFATDSLDAQKIIGDYAAKSSSHDIVLVPHPELVHLDRVRLFANEEKKSQTPGISNMVTTVDISVKTISSVEQIYPVFVDLLLMAGGNCISFGDGGYGKFALVLSRNYSCSYRHIRRHQIQKCSYDL